ncbi:MAG: single-stranded-DNA-specific exonuclease RecJ [Nautilia sp.]|nr:MAG: single-stranded-DNA-specific exonuclease RecJ [Nautilia sp.]
MLTKLQIQQILSEKIKEISPKEIYHFSLLKNIDKATKRIIKAINNNEKIVIVGDYDVDGVVSSTIINQFFKKIDYPIEIIIPDRFEDGYGLTPKLMDKIKCDVLITVDNGISSYEAAIICKNKNIDLIITDHHTPTYPLPDAYTIIDPKQKDETFPFKEICGAEVAWYLIASLKTALNLNIDMREFLDYLVLAIIADVMPLNDLNRILVKMGLSKLAKSQKPFAIILREALNKEIFNSEDIGFNIAPKLNSAGRIKHAKIAFNFLNSEDLYSARKLYSELNETNNYRKEIEKDISNFCIDNNQNNHFIIASGPFHEGVIGIVASRLVHHYKLPAIVFAEKGDILKGSGRSLGDVNIYNLIKECEEFIEGFGGHKLACGLSIKKENLEKFTEKINLITSKIPKENFYLDEFLLGELSLKECDFELLEILKSFEPYGEGNPKPKFKAKVNIENIRNLKDNHYKLIVSQNGVYKDAIIFRYDGEFEQEMTMIFTIEENNWNGNVNIQLMIDRFE